MKFENFERFLYVELVKMLGMRKKYFCYFFIDILFIKNAKKNKIPNKGFNNDFFFFFPMKIHTFSRNNPVKSFFSIKVNLIPIYSDILHKTD